MTGAPHREQPRPRHLREAHAHLHMLGEALSMLSLESCACTEECLDRVARAASEMEEGGAAPGAWLKACAMRVEGWREPRWPTRTQLDRACPLRPCVLMSFDHHSVAANSAAMRTAGFHDDAPDPEGGVIVRDSGGVPTGVLLESAAKRVWAAAPEPAEHERPAIVRSALDHLTGLGFTEVHDLLSPLWLGPLLASMHDRGELHTDVRLYPLMQDIDVAAGLAASFTRPGIRLAGGKIFADGTLNSRTAWMLHPYADGMPHHPCGTPLMRPPGLRKAMEHAASLDLSLAVHAIGDGAVRATLDAWESALRDGAVKRRSTTGERGLRIEHCEVIDETDVPRFAAMDVLCSVQPCHLLADVEALDRAIPGRLDRVLPLRELIDAGCAPGVGMVFGSDVPIVRADPTDSVQAALHRRRDGQPVEQAIAPEQAISDAQAWAAFA